MEPSIGRHGAQHFELWLRIFTPRLICTGPGWPNSASKPGGGPVSAIMKTARRFIHGIRSVGNGARDGRVRPIVGTSACARPGADGGTGTGSRDLSFAQPDGPPGYFPASRAEGRRAGERRILSAVPFCWTNRRRALEAELRLRHAHRRGAPSSVARARRYIRKLLGAIHRFSWRIEHDQGAAAATPCEMGRGGGDSGRRYSIFEAGRGIKKSRVSSGCGETRIGTSRARGISLRADPHP